MVILIQAQRASIILFQNFATMLIKGLEKENRMIKQEMINNLLNLQEKYVSFQNQLLFFEVTPEEQGVEIYNKLARVMYIDEEKKELKEQLDGLYMATNTIQDNNFNKYALLLALVTIFLAFLTFSYDTLNIFTTKNKINFFGVILCGVLTIIVIGILFKYIYKKFKR